MEKSPQRPFMNVCLVVAVLITLFLTANTVIQNLFGWLVSNKHTTESVFEIAKLVSAGASSLIIMVLLFLLTGLGRSIFCKQAQL